jgi:hypothetical protein
MTFAKFVVLEGEIIWRGEVDTDAMEPHRLAVAKDILTHLRRSAEGTGAPIPNTVFHSVHLGSTQIDHLRKFPGLLDEDNAPSLTQEERDEFNQDFERQIQHLLKWRFQIKQRNYFTWEYAIVPTTLTKESGATLRSAVASTTFIPRERWHKDGYRDRWQAASIIVDTIEAARPCLVSFSEDDFPACPFVNVFAAAMLIEQEAHH